MNNIQTPEADVSGREIVISRLIDAPRALVFEAWTDPQHLGHWWGPNGFTTTTHEIDVKEGGKWRFIMHGPDGRDYPNLILYKRIVSPERIEIHHCAKKEGEKGSFNQTTEFTDEDGKTRVTMRSVFRSAEERDHVVKVFGAIEGGKQHLRRLEEYVASLA